MKVGFLDVRDGASMTLEAPELEGRPNVQNHGNEEGDTRAPQKSRDAAERGGVLIDFFGRQVDLEIAEEMGDYETEKNKAGYGHDGFFADGGLPESQRGGQVYRGGAHGM